MFVVSTWKILKNIIIFCLLLQNPTINKIIWEINGTVQIWSNLILYSNNNNNNSSKITNKNNNNNNINHIKTNNNSSYITSTTKTTTLYDDNSNNNNNNKNQMNYRLQQMTKLSWYNHQLHSLKVTSVVK